MKKFIYIFLFFIFCNIAVANNFIKGDARNIKQIDIGGWLYKVCNDNDKIWNFCTARVDMASAPKEIFNKIIDSNYIKILNEYKGSVKNNFPHGAGILSFKNETYVFVIFDNGKLQKIINLDEFKQYNQKERIEMKKDYEFKLARDASPYAFYESRRGVGWREVGIYENGFSHVECTYSNGVKVNKPWNDNITPQLDLWGCPKQIKK